MPNGKNEIEIASDSYRVRAAGPVVFALLAALVVGSACALTFYLTMQTIGTKPEVRADPCTGSTCSAIQRRLSSLEKTALSNEGVRQSIAAVDEKSSLRNRAINQRVGDNENEFRHTAKMVLNLIREISVLKTEIRHLRRDLERQLKSGVESDEAIAQR